MVYHGQGTRGSKSGCLIWAPTLFFFVAVGINYGPLFRTWKMMGTQADHLPAHGLNYRVRVVLRGAGVVSSWVYVLGGAGEFVSS